MGYMRHHAVLVTSWEKEAIEKARVIAVSLFGEDMVSQTSPPSINGYVSFAVFPDGSKEGWEESDRGDIARAEFVQYMRENVYEDGSSCFGWLEVQYGDDEHQTLIVNSSDDDMRRGLGECDEGTTTNIHFTE